MTPIVHVIRAVGVQAFQDRDSIPYGESWRVVIEDSIAKASKVLVFWCDHARASEHVRREYRQALQLQRSVVPARLDGTPLCPELAPFQAVELQALAPGHDADTASAMPQRGPRIDRAVAPGGGGSHRSGSEPDPEPFELEQRERKVHALAQLLERLIA